MFEAWSVLVQPNSEESMSEASSSTGTLPPHSPFSDGAESELATDHSLTPKQVLDPLRFPVQNGDVIANDTQILLQNKNSRSATYYEEPIINTKRQNEIVSALNSNIKTNSEKVSNISSTNLGNMNVRTTLVPFSQTVTPVPSKSSHHKTSFASNITEIKNTSTTAEVTKSANLQMSELEISLPSTETYKPETVDFPSSPRSFRTFNTNLVEVVRLADGEGELIKPPPAQQEEDDDKPTFTAIANPPTGKVILKKVERPKNLEGIHKKRITVNEELLHSNVEEDIQSVSSLSYHNSEDDYDDDAQMLSHDEFTDMLTPDDIETPDELEESIMERLGHEHNPDLSISSHPESTADEKSWRAVVLSGIERRIDLKVIEPYKKVLSHGGYMPSGSNEAIIVFSACFLPDRSRKDYDYVMDHLFMYVLTTLDQLIGEDYVLVYLHGATTRGNMPSFAWLKRCYQMIDRRLRKNLQGLYLVHPTFWVKTVVVMARPFVSSKFARKLRFISNLKELASLIPLDQVCIPSRVKQYDAIRESLIQKKA